MNSCLLLLLIVCVLWLASFVFLNSFVFFCCFLLAFSFLFVFVCLFLNLCLVVSPFGVPTSTLFCVPCGSGGLGVCSVVCVVQC